MGIGHEDWDNVPDSDLLAMHEYLHPLSCDLGMNWFALWIPLRKSQDGFPQFRATCFGDSSEACADELGSMLSLDRLSRSLPLLHVVESIRIWNCWDANGGTPTDEIELQSKSARSRYRHHMRGVQDAEACNEPIPTFDTDCAEGQYIARNNGRDILFKYAIAQSWCEELLTYRNDPGWPKSFNLTRVQSPDKARPHAAVVLTRQCNSLHPGTMDVATAAFLPLERHSADSASCDAEYLLTLHGCFFVDSGRRHTVRAGNDVRGRWNKDLWNKGVFPLVIMALAKLASTMREDVGGVRTLTACLAAARRDEQPLYPEHRSAICQRTDWLFRWRSEGGGWSEAYRSGPLFEIPEFREDSSLPGRALPALAKLAEEAILTPFGWPRGGLAAVRAAAGSILRTVAKGG